MKHEMTYANADGTIEKAPMVHLQINAKQQAVILGVDLTARPELEPYSLPGVDIFRMGKLNEVGIILQAQLINSLYFNEWDFEAYPDPEVLILTDNRPPAQLIVN